MFAGFQEPLVEIDLGVGPGAQFSSALQNLAANVPDDSIEPVKPSAAVSDLVAQALETDPG
jgi:hypothetical protein